MTQRMLMATLLLTALLGVSLLAQGTFDGSFTADILLQSGVSPFKSFHSVFELDYRLGGFTATSTSEMVTVGFIWQGFGVTGQLGALELQGDILFGPSTSDYLYGQSIASISLAGVELSVYAAQLSGAVLGGPASGMAVRVAGSSGGPTVESVTELGAHIDGITVFHAATGLSMEYVTNPMVGVQTCSDCCTVTFTGEKLTISGMPFCCLEEVTTTFYVTCAGGFEYVRFDLQGIDVPAWPWLLFDASLTFEVDEKALAIAPTLRLGEWTCIDLYTELSSLNPLLFDGVRFYGLGLTCTLGDVTLKSLSVFDTGRHAITTPTYGSVIESLADAVAAGHTYYPDYWELFSIEVVGDGCCGTQYRFLANTYFDAASAMLFDWGMSHMEVTLPLNPEFMLTGSLEVSEAGLEWFGVGLTFTF